MSVQPEKPYPLFDSESGHVFNIPAGVPFADSLAHGILVLSEEKDIPLTSFRILLPTRRACRNLRDTFLRLSEGKPLLLPRLQPIGDVEEDELMIELAGKENAKLMTELKPALSPMRRCILLARAIMQIPEYTRGPEQDFALAAALGSLMDQVYTEDLDWKDLPSLVQDSELARHWEVTVTFLKILSERWPAILEAQGVIDAADRRNRLLHALCDHWEQHPPQGPIIAAGSTGSIPVTGRLIKTIASLPQGYVVLPGLDTDIDGESWDVLEEGHPQKTLKILLARIGVQREEIKSWPYRAAPSRYEEEPPALTTRKRKMRAKLASEMMRPADTAHKWESLSLTEEERHDLENSLSQVMRFECDTAQEEAKLIAMLMRDTLSTPGKTAALITPDRNLGRRVANTCQRWGIEVDDSGGQPLSSSPLGSYLRLIMQLATSNVRPSVLAALLKHKYCNLGRGRTDLIALTDALEMEILRGPLSGGGFEALYKHVAEIEEEKKIVIDTDFLKEIEQRLTPLLVLKEKGYVRFTEYLHAHIAVAEDLGTRIDMGGAEALWQGEAGEAAASFLADLNEQSDILPHVDDEHYLAILEQFMRTINVHPRYGTHPRLYILGQLESRLLKADLVILSGLNEGNWPPDAANDPWMSRPMRKDFNLPAPERSIGLAAHDFVQGFCAPNVIITRAKRMDGTPTVPARWLQRLDTVLQALSIDKKAYSFDEWLKWAQALDKPDGDPAPYERPAPTPPADKRPQELYVTAVERWMRDPYHVYARYILRLRKLDDLEEKADAAQRGTMMHDVLDRFIQGHKDHLPDDAHKRLLTLGEEMLSEKLQDPRLWGFWRPRFERLADWFVGHERQWRQNATPHQTETEGSASLNIDGIAFTLRARADRIDTVGADGAAVIDYKTGSVPSKKDVEKGFSPQLPLEALILLESGFAGVQAENVPYMGFWKMTGAAEAGKDVDVTTDAEAARQGFIKLVRTFRDEKTPYYSLPRPDKAPMYQDYAHLARVQEWAALDDSGEEAA